MGAQKTAQNRSCGVSQGMKEEGEEGGHAWGREEQVVGQGTGKGVGEHWYWGVGHVVSPYPRRAPMPLGVSIAPFVVFPSIHALFP